MYCIDWKMKVYESKGIAKGIEGTFSSIYRQAGLNK